MSFHQTFLTAGLGQAFSASGASAAVIRTALVTAFKLRFSRVGSCTLVQNAHDQTFLTGKVGLDAESVTLSRGIGVGEQSSMPQDEARDGEPVVTMVSRLLWAEGVQELVDAGAILRERGIAVRIRLMGMANPTSPVSLLEGELRRWHAEGYVEWLG